MIPLIRTDTLCKTFAVGRRKQIHALRQVSLSVYQGETLGIVGESGCGKSTLARVIMGAYPPTSGCVFYEENQVLLKNQKDRLDFAKRVQMVFQDPYTSLDSRMTVEGVIEENLIIHHLGNRQERRERVLQLLEMVGLGSYYAGCFPHQLSGGQRQRVGIARALAANPRVVVCDEAISALDISVQSQMINLLKTLGRDLNLTYLFIAHDLNAVHYISDRVAVMYMGQVVELASSRRLFENPVHPYTKMLMDAVLPVCPDPQGLDKREALPVEGGTVPSDLIGCLFQTRCPFKQEGCRRSEPALVEVEPDHYSRCFLKR